MNLRFHSKPLYYVAYCVSRHAKQMILNLDNLSLLARNEDMNMKWESKCIPSGRIELLYPSNVDEVTDSMEAD